MFPCCSDIAIQGNAWLDSANFIGWRDTGAKNSKRWHRSPVARGRPFQSRLEMSVEESSGWEGPHGEGGGEGGRAVKFTSEHGVFFLALCIC